MASEPRLRADPSSNAIVSEPPKLLHGSDRLHDIFGRGVLQVICAAKQ